MTDPELSIAIRGRLIAHAQQILFRYSSRSSVVCLVKVKQLQRGKIISHDATLDDLTNDDDDNAPADCTVRGTIVGVFEVDPYLACPKSTCNNKKLITIEKKGTLAMHCPTCSLQCRGSSSSWFARASVFFESDDGTTKKVQIFKPELIKMLSAKNMEPETGLDRTELLDTMMKLIPIDIKCHIENNIIKNLVCKRPLQPTSATEVCL
ncbi:LOW QUALITY PROTEIN: uncharacterized protein LOC117318021 [Pecten maximus]|uniref:LOW QUALITY PROTEIN: uncharacterized protein LOC117318021 n=1 Tax=Pecten maximus TaxID=6579 RepID=UPI001458C955|nr:LOW QUALITY PROTEIN: uncharacterized protein LOC117318021 [Pecten maximus]